ncbi:hydroxyacylglutathione hydrolase [Neisseria weaveri]|uniref:hydroxyacylglutathione hydrolase n=1 Tax=Neisseria weaveri TaxID=28091 RepID=UPI000D302146|nr:hydroxyacylglutathione hydrolase [Neisseria weaveri]
MKIVPVRAFQDNYIWLLQEGGKAVCVDPGEAGPVLAYLKQHGLALEQIWITHHYHDHIGGIAGLLESFPQCRIFGNHDIGAADNQVAEGSRWQWENCSVEVWETYGHTDSHLSYIVSVSDNKHVFCGDTLFSAGCGRIFTGTAQQMFASLQRYLTLHEATLFYPAHEYTAANLRFAAHIEPENQDIARAAASEKMPTLPVRLEHECKVNPFLRVHVPAIARRVEALSGKALHNDLEVFAAMRELKNRF